MELLDYLLCIKPLFTMGTYHDRAYTKGDIPCARTASDEVESPDRGESPVLGVVENTSRKRVSYRDVIEEACDRSIGVSRSFCEEKNADVVNKKVKIDEPVKEGMLDKPTDAVEEDTLGSRYAFEKSKLARTRTVAVCQRRRDAPSLWAWERDGKKRSSDDNIVGKVMNYVRQIMRPAAGDIFLCSQANINEGLLGGGGGGQT